MHSRDTGPHLDGKQPTAPARTPTVAPDLGQGELSPQAVLALQRTVGNDAVSRMVQQARHGDAEAASVQRAPSEGSSRRSARTAASRPAAVRSTLAAQPLGGGYEEEGACGYFVRRRDWAVQPPQRGFIIQKITRHFQVDRLVPGENGAPGTWQPLSGAAIDGYITDPNSAAFATVSQYWELWKVKENGQVEDGGDDTFSLCSIIPNGQTTENTTRGRYTMTGEAYFYPSPDPALRPSQIGFARNRAAPAGGLFSALNDPAQLISEKGLVASNRVGYTTTVTWDSSTGNENDLYSSVT